MGTILAIASGGAIGAVLRHFTGLLIPGVGATLAVNIAGSFLMGVLIVSFTHYWNPSQELKAFLSVGLLGAFTTFSTFSLNVATLWERGEIFVTIGYIVASVIFSIFALFAGMFIIRQVLT